MNHAIRVTIITAVLTITAAFAQTGAPLLLNYHQIDVRTLLTYSPSRTDLDGHITNLKTHAYTISNTRDFLNNVTNGDRVALLTFDDGRKSVITNAYPVLSTHGVTATIFVIAGLIGEDDYLTTEDIQELHANGWEIGNHTLSHAALTDLRPNSIQTEIQRTNEILKSITGEKPACVAYPFGLHDAVVREIVRQHNECAFTTAPGIAHAGTDPLSIPRPPLSQDDNRTLRNGQRATSITSTVVALGMLTWPLPDTAPLGSPPATWTPTLYRSLGDGRYSVTASLTGVSHELSAREGPWALHVLHGRGTSRAHAIGLARNFGQFTAAATYVISEGPGFGISYDFGNRTEPWAYWTLNGGIRAGIRIVPIDYTSITGTWDFTTNNGTIELTAPIPIMPREGYPLRASIGYDQALYAQVSFRAGGNALALNATTDGTINLNLTMNW